MVDDPEMVEMVEEEIRDLLSKYDFPGERNSCYSWFSIKSIRR